MLLKWVNGILDFLYLPFRKIVPRQTFRYAVCGGGNTLLDIFIYVIAFHFIVQKQVVYTPVIAIKPHIASFLISFCVSFPTGYLLNRYVVFTDSILRGRIQLFRYFLLVLACLGLNYVFIRLFVEHFDIYPSVAKILTTVIVVSFSYVTQKRFTFKGEPL